MLNRSIFFLSSFLFFSCSVFGQFKLANIFGDEMVLQRNKEIKIWGWSEEGNQVSINFQADEYNTVTNSDGKWLIEMKNYPAGGPYIIKIKSGNQVVNLKNIYVGDVWLCSGQSNMYMKMKSVKQNYPEEFGLIEYDNIRFINIPSQLNFKSLETDIKASKWSQINPKSIYKISAAAYFFAKELHSNLDIPIGLIISAVGGSPVESWFSEESALRYESVAIKLKEAQSDGFLEKLSQQDSIRRLKWFESANEKINNLDFTYNPISFDHTYKYKSQPFHRHNGVYWFKKEFKIDDISLSNSRIYLGKIGDSDSTFLNGEFIGKTKSRYIDREYLINNNSLKKDLNTLEIKVYNYRWRAGFMFGDIIELKSNEKNIKLMSNWQYAELCEMPTLKPGENRFWRPVGLYNGMIAPLEHLKLSGVIWYQGEANAKNKLAFDYRNRFTSLIKDWRLLFNDIDLPFLYVQLPNYLKPNAIPSKSAWAMLRESQLKVSDLINVGMITSLDIGEKNDIHPKNKKDIGFRLANEAMRVAYKDGSASKFGTYLEDVTFNDENVIVKFTEKELKYNGDGKHFNISIAGEDKVFYWAKVSLKNGVLTAWSDKVSKPIAIRYAWANNPSKPLIINKFNIPISPFRSDDW